MLSHAPLDAGAILAALVGRGVDFVVIGGIASVLHGSARNTFDLDICFSVEPANLGVLGAVLTEVLQARLLARTTFPSWPMSERSAAWRC